MNRDEALLLTLPLGQTGSQALLSAAACDIPRDNIGKVVGLWMGLIVTKHSVLPIPECRWPSPSPLLSDILHDAELKGNCDWYGILCFLWIYVSYVQ